MTKQFKIQIRLLLVAIFLQITGTIATTIWQISLIQELVDINAEVSYELAYRWLLGVDLFLIVAAVIVYWRKRFNLVSMLLLFLSILCQISVYHLGASARAELLSIFTTSSDIDGLIADGTFSASSIPWFTHSGWQWWFWMWITSGVTGFIFVWEIIRRIFVGWNGLDQSSTEEHS